MKLVPTHKQWQNWSLPSKYSLIGVLIGIIALLVTLFTVLPEPKATYKSQKKFYKEIAYGLNYFSKNEIEKAIVHFDKSLKYSDTPNQNSVFKWLSESYARTKNYESSFEQERSLYSNLADSLNHLDYKFIAFARAMSLYRNKEYYKCLEFIDKMISNSIELPIYEIIPLCYAAIGDTMNLRNTFTKYKFYISEDPFYRKIQFEIWQNISKILDKPEFALQYFISESFIKKIFSEEYEKQAFFEYNPLVNFYKQSLAKREIYQNLLDMSLLGDSVDFYLNNYKKEVLFYGLDIGSNVSLLIYLDFITKDSLAQNWIVPFLMESKTNNETTIQFCPLWKNDTLKILWIAGKPWFENAINHPSFDDLREQKLMGEKILRCINLTPDSMWITPINSDEVIFSYFIEALALDNKPYDFAIIETAGSFEGKTILNLDVETDKFTTIYPDSEDTDLSYHSFDYHTITRNDSTYNLKWFYEFDDVCHANIQRKIFGKLNVDLQFNGKTKINNEIANPALEFYKSNLATKDLRAQSILLNSVSIQKHQILDDDFLRLIQNQESICFRLSLIDEVYLYRPKKQWPNISCLELTSAQTGNQFIILVKRLASGIRVLDIFKIKDNKLVSIIKEKS